MILTGKAKEDFLKWYYGKGNKKINFKAFSLDVAKSIQNALIIDFFDHMESNGERFYLTFFEFNLKHKLPNWGFKEISEKAIQQCNDFYNDLEHNQLPTF